MFPCWNIYLNETRGAALNWDGMAVGGGEPLREVVEAGLIDAGLRTVRDDLSPLRLRVEGRCDAGVCIPAQGKSG